MATSSVVSAAKWLGNLAVEEVQYLAAVQDKVENLQSELKYVSPFLIENDAKNTTNDVRRQYVSDIRDLALDGEDLIGTYILEVSHKRLNKGLLDYLKWLSCCLMDAWTLHGVGSDIDALKETISKKYTLLQKYDVESNNHSQDDDMEVEIARLRRTYPHVVNEYLVGLEESKLQLMRKLQCRNQPMVVVVFGMGGIGKTTFAREVFNSFKNGNLERNFDGFAWAYISQRLQLGEVLREILRQLVPKKDKDSIGKLHDSELHEKLYNMLKQKKYLVVLDDCWSRRDWELLEDAFPLSSTSRGSKLLVTTRIPQILSGQTDGVSYYEIKKLDSEKSWQLLQKKAAHLQREITDPQKVELGRKMLCHCDGHPLAITVLGGVLATKKSVAEWQSVYENLRFHLRPGEYTGVYKVLAMSYYELPYDLKACFRLLGNFPEGFEISVEELYHLWIAEGITSLSPDKFPPGTSLEFICEEFLNELVQKSMVQVESRDDLYGKIETCRLHDLMRDNCIEICREENFLLFYDNHARDEGQRNPTVIPWNEKLRRIAIYVDDEVSYPIPQSRSGKLPLRSILFFNSHRSRDCRCILPLCEDFKLLRVLDFKGLKLMGCLPEGVGSLKFLTYLSLNDTLIDELPSSIENLRLLMILDLRVLTRRLKIPNLIWKMKSLTYLYLPTFFLNEAKYEIESGNMLKLGQLSQLEKLENVDLDGVDDDGLVELMGSIKNVDAVCKSKKDNLVPLLKSGSIKSLTLDIGLSIIRELEDPKTILSACHALKALKIRKADSDMRSALSLTPGMFPQNLVVLSIIKCIIQEDPMPILETLPNLKSLELFQCYDDDELVCSENGFPELTDLFLCRLGSTIWIVQDGGLPKLQEVEIYDCPFERLPDCLPSQVSIKCDPCVNGFERYGNCPFESDREDDDDDGGNDDDEEEE